MSDPFPRDDAIRVVPLHSQAELAALIGDSPAAAPTQLTYRGGPLLTAVEVFTVFWGVAWRSDETLVSDVNAFFSDILASELIDQLGEYSVPAYAKGALMKPAARVVASTPPPFVTVNVCECVEPFASMPKSKVGPSEIVSCAGAAPVP